LINDLVIALNKVKLEKSFIPKLTVSSQNEFDDTITISGEVDFDDLDTKEMDCSIMISVNGGVWKKAIGKSRWSYVSDASELKEGDVFEVKLLDGISNPTIKETVAIDGGDSVYLILAVVCIVIVILAILLLILKRRGTHKEEKKEPE